MQTNIPIKIQIVKSLSTAQPSRIVAVKADGDTTFTLWVTDKTGVPYPLKDNTGGGGGTIEAIQNTDGNLTITGTTTKTINVSSSLLLLINSTLQAGDNVSSLTNDANYITLADIPAFVASDYDLEDFTNAGVDPFAHLSDLSGGVTNLSYTASPTQGIINSDTGTDATIPLADGTNAGLLSPTDKIKLDNTGDQDLQSVLDNGGYAEKDLGESYISILDGLEHSRAFEVVTSNGFDNSTITTESTRVTLQNSDFEAGSAHISIDNGLIQLGQFGADNVVSSTVIDITPPTNNTFLKFPAPSVDGTYTIATTSDGIPITGTTVGNPVSGIIETESITGLSSTQSDMIIGIGNNKNLEDVSKYSTVYFGSSIGSNTTSIIAQSNLQNTGIAVIADDDTGLSKVVILSTDPQSKGLSAEQDFSPNITDFDYTQKIYVDTKEPLKGIDDNYVTDAEKVIIGNTSGTNTGDQDLSGYAPLATIVTEKNTSFTLTDADVGIPFVITASCTVTIPNGLIAGFNATFVTLTGVTLTVALGGSVVLHNNAGTSLLEKSSFTLQARTTTNNYITAGAL